jgi:hypothetical protein
MAHRFFLFKIVIVLDFFIGSRKIVPDPTLYHVSLPLFRGRVREGVIKFF